VEDGQRAGLALTRGVTSSSQHCGECLVGPEDRDHPLHIIGQYLQAHLGPDPIECSGQEVSGAHLGLDGAEYVFDRLAAYRHGLWRLVQPLLHRVEHGFVLPALDPAFLARRAVRLDGATLALRRPIVT